MAFDKSKLDLIKSDRAAARTQRRTEHATDRTARITAAKAAVEAKLAPVREAREKARAERVAKLPVNPRRLIRDLGADGLAQAMKDPAQAAALIGAALGGTPLKADDAAVVSLGKLVPAKPEKVKPTPPEKVKPAKAEAVVAESKPAKP